MVFCSSLLAPRECCSISHGSSINDRTMFGRTWKSSPTRRFGRSSCWRWFWPERFLIVEKFFLKPYYELGRHVENFVLSGSANGSEIDRKNALGNLPVGIQALARAQIDADHAREMAVEKATRTLAEQKNTLGGDSRRPARGSRFAISTTKSSSIINAPWNCCMSSGSSASAGPVFRDGRTTLPACPGTADEPIERRSTRNPQHRSTQFIASTTRDHSTLEGRVGLITEDGPPHGLYRNL